MPIMLVDSQISFVPLTMDANDFPRYLLCGLENGPETFNIEKLGHDLVICNFKIEQTLEFVKAVCKWGGYAGVAGKVLKHNQPKAIADALRSAHEESQKNEIRAALRIVVSVKCLAVSFASKHLKFLDPTRHVVLDSIISTHLGYARDKAGFGYEAFVADCARILEAVKASNVPYPVEGNTGWRIADIEMAIYQRILSG